jgi:hypothetical protein
MEKYKQLIRSAQEPLSDNAYLDKWISDVYQFKSHEVCNIKNTNSTYVMATPIFAKMLVGYDNISRVIGRFGIGDDESGLPPKTATLSNIFFQQDREVEKTREIKYQINILDYYTGFTIVKCFKVPIINHATNNVIGTFAQNNEFIPDNTLKTILNIHGERFGTHTSIDVSNHSNKFYFTKLEQEVLFCVCLGISNKKHVAQFLSFIHKKDVCADTTVNDAFRRLYRKLGCKTSVQLIEHAVANNLHTQIPASFLTYGSFSLS